MYKTGANTLQTNVSSNAPVVHNLKVLIGFIGSSTPGITVLTSTEMHGNETGHDHWSWKSKTARTFPKT